MKIKLLTSVFLLSLLFGDNLSAKKPKSGLPGCPVVEKCIPAKRKPCDESKTPGGGDGPGPGKCWDDCSCNIGRYCDTSGIDQTGTCQDRPTLKGSKKSMSKGSTPKK